MTCRAGHRVAAVAAVVGARIIVVVVVTIGGARGSLRTRVGELLVDGFLLNLNYINIKSILTGRLFRLT